MGYRFLAAADAHWRLSNQMRVANTDLSKQLEIFNHTASDQLWLICGAPPETANTLEMTDEQLHVMYPDGPKALPPELESSPPGAGA